MLIKLSRGLLWFLCILPVLCWSQEFRATVTGHVIDPSNAAVANVVVQVLNLSTNEKATAVTDNQGTYTAPFLRQQVNWNAGLSAETQAGLSDQMRDWLGLGVTANTGKSSKLHYLSDQYPREKI